MCRSIKKLRSPERQPTDEELYEAALQYVRKVSGYRTPSKANQQIFERAITDISKATRELLQNITVRST